MMLGIPVLQVYGLTETTAICTMDDPGHVEPGHVGPAIPGIEMTVAENGEILVRGPNIFPGYWQRPAETAKALAGGWFHTGDQGEVDASGNWRVTGRLKNLIVLNSGHNIAPEPLEQKLAAQLPEAQQVVLVGNQRSFLGLLVTVPSANGSYRRQSSVGARCAQCGSAALQADPRFSRCSRAVHARKWPADGERQTQARRDRRALCRRNRRDVPKEARMKTFRERRFPGA